MGGILLTVYDTSVIDILHYCEIRTAQQIAIKRRDFRCSEWTALYKKKARKTRQQVARVPLKDVGNRLVVILAG